MKVYDHKRIRRMQLNFSIVLFILIAILCLNLYIKTESGPFPDLDPKTQGIFKLLMIVYSTLVIFSSQWAFKRKIQLINPDAGYNQKIRFYKNALIVKWISISGSLLFSYLVLLISDDYMILVLSGLMLVILFLNFPTNNRIIKEVPLLDREKEKLLKQDD